MLAQGFSYWILGRFRSMPFLPSLGSGWSGCYVWRCACVFPLAASWPQDGER